MELNLEKRLLKKNETAFVGKETQLSNLEKRIRKKWNGARWNETQSFESGETDPERN